MNVYDAARMTDMLAPLGYAPTGDAAEADLVVLNTCHIREKAAEKVFSDLGRLRLIKDERSKNGKRTVVAVAGCVAQAQGEKLIERAPVVDVVVGPQVYHRLPEMLARIERQAGRAIDTSFPEIPKFDYLPAPTTAGPSAFLSIQEGCDKFCAYCVVPYTRGAEYSRPVADIVSEARGLVDQGAREITLLGQNVNAYHGEDEGGRASSLGRLLERLAAIDGLERLRYTTSHPRDVDDSLVEAHRDIPALMPLVHLPVQSGSDRMLSAMNRGHTRAEYLATIDRLRSARDDMAFASDFIVGHPGETEEDFQDTLSLVDAVGFVHSYAFKFSPRPGTPAAALPDSVTAEEKSDRLSRLLKHLAAVQSEQNHRMIGRVVPVLLDRPGRQDGQLLGRSPWMQPVHLRAPDARMGDMITVRITAAGPLSLSGTPFTAPDIEALRHSA
ncbi:tRNA (N6-isopentenyl adenosine(37)-C2)-methylthiotransferase MiaB [Phaeovibrio sulfidiphilus]|uniref:tRNA-2-methylthio-N(6)-dimethylallyladenosine synthase n=2 Tax=Phaeovibrio sulfidiphilus TaxID=1220600 RepID=A0A8J6YNR0_9PROT|nr:tRNA (N6-isopentenyl adenosine(37)-C2)-methylthiotransferase MiaB [Phaeovibrio sulfidiphilus]